MVVNATVTLVGPGLVGSALLKQLASQVDSPKSALKNEGIVFHVRRVSRSSKTYTLAEGQDITCWTEGDCTETDLNSIASTPSCGINIIVDCTASADVTACYEKWLRNGYHVVTANKKANSGPLEVYKRIREAARMGSTKFMYEANVGAGLPIISTIREMFLTGDTVLGIEGVLSGTLSFLFNEYDGSQSFASVVRRARDLGYTEPDPREDLSGLDVARKVVILAREVGLAANLETVSVESLVPEGMRGGEMDAEEFLSKLEENDGGVAKRLPGSGSVLRYVGIVSPGPGICSVELREYPASHPFGRLAGSDNILSIKSERYAAQPLVVQGPGAGAEVTAAGVFGDMLKVVS